MRVTWIAAALAVAGLLASVIAGVLLAMQAHGDTALPARVVDARPWRVTYEGMPRGGRALLEQHRAFTAIEERDLDAWVREGGDLAIVVRDTDAWARPGDWIDPLPEQWGVRYARGWRAARGCTVADGGRLADCRIGEGRVLLDAGDDDPQRRAGLARALASGDPVAPVAPPLIATRMLAIMLAIAIATSVVASIVWAVAMLGRSRSRSGPPLPPPARVTRSIPEEMG